MSNLGLIKKKRKKKMKWHQPKDENAQIAQEALLEVIDNQIRDNDPPETRKTLERLITEGFSEIESKKLIACVVSVEMFNILKNEVPYKHEKFIKGLNSLPKLPWD